MKSFGDEEGAPNYRIANEKGNMFFSKNGKNFSEVIGYVEVNCIGNGKLAKFMMQPRNFWHTGTNLRMVPARGLQLPLEKKRI